MCQPGPEEALAQRSPTVLAPGTRFVEDSFSTDWRLRGEDGLRTMRAHDIYCALYFVAVSGYSTSILGLELGLVNSAKRI